MANEDWAKNPETRPEVLAMLSTSPSEAVRLLVAQNPSTPETALMHLAKDESDAVRKNVTLRSNVSSEVLRVALLPREALAELEAAAAAPAPEPEPAPVETPVYTPEYAQPEPVSAAPAKKPSIFAWFWRLLGRSA